MVPTKTLEGEKRKEFYSAMVMLPSSAGLEPAAALLRNRF